MSTSSFNRILIVNVNWLGDALFVAPAIRALRVAFPKSFIASISHRRVTSVLRHNPDLDEVLSYSPAFFWDTLSRRFDTVIFFHASRTKAFWAALAGIPNRIGYETAKNKAFLTQAVVQPAKLLHRVDYFLSLVSEMGADAKGRQSEFCLKTDEEEKFKNSLIKKGIDFLKPYVVVHAGGNWDLKRWPEDYFAKWISLFASKYNWPVILCGTDSEKNLVDEIIRKSVPERLVSLCGKTSLEELAVLLKNSKLVLSNDSGPIHLAASQGAKIIGLYGPTRADLTGPILQNKGVLLQKDVGCEIPCYFKSCNARFCLEWLTPEEVFAESVKILESI